MKQMIPFFVLVWLNALFVNHTAVSGVSPALMYEITILAGISTMINSMLVSAPVVKIIQAGVKWNKSYLEG